nr:hypothetical protein [Tanacetum cinerariifolium]
SSGDGRRIVIGGFSDSAGLWPPD